MNDKEKLEAIKEIIDIYDMIELDYTSLGEDVKKIKKILDSQSYLENSFVVSSFIYIMRVGIIALGVALGIGLLFGLLLKHLFQAFNNLFQKRTNISSIS